MWYSYKNRGFFMMSKATFTEKLNIIVCTAIPTQIPCGNKYSAGYSKKTAQPQGRYRPFEVLFRRYLLRFELDVIAGSTIFAT
ncbi:hypothetical protein MKW98_002406 [Papaver atlanticum]|uniref:Uncharacterized protein n=1 Tax=Papaver atlanticum TaxID=357466 RepID=A0AAD4SBB5_9MAGN|nr:hypothetical protein MKW98_002406 [Papaver atlanticum]